MYLTRRWSLPQSPVMSFTDASTEKPVCFFQYPQGAGEHLVSEGLAQALVLHQEVEHLLLEEPAQHLGIMVGVDRESMERTLRVEGTVGAQAVQVHMWIDLVAKELGEDDQADLDVVAFEPRREKGAGGLSRRPAQPGKKLGVAVEALSQAFGEHEHQPRPLRDRDKWL